MLEIKYSFVDDSDKMLGIPQQGSQGAAGWDVRANLKEPERSSGIAIKPGCVSIIPTGFALELPKGYECQVRSRSGLCIDHRIMVLNSPGTIDCDYRGEVFVILANLGDSDFRVDHGGRIAQLVFAAVPEVRFVSRPHLSKTKRGISGFGSTGSA